MSSPGENSDDVRPLTRKEVAAIGAKALREAAAGEAAPLRKIAAPGAQSCPPPNFPPGIPVSPATYQNWSLAITVPDLWTARPAGSADVVTLANWARAEGFTLRARGRSHNWSPILVPNGTDPCSKVLLVDTTGLKGTLSFDHATSTVTCGTGTTVDELTLYLENLDNQGQSAAPGYSLVNMTAPGDLSLGGVLTIGAHGTSLPYPDAPVEQPAFGFGSMSNLVTAFKAVVTDPAGADPTVYVEKTFQRSDPDAGVFLTHLGRCFLTEVSLKVVPNYYLQVTNRYPDAKVLFGAPTFPAPADSISALLDRFGRIEVIWFPFTTKPWVKTWDLKTEKIEPQVEGPYNYPWANNISIEQSNLIKAGLFIAPWTTPGFGTGQLLVSELNAPDGAVMNGTSRDLLLYVQASTLRVTSYGYAIQIRRQDVQDVAHRVCMQFDAQLKAYQNQGKYPVNGPLELRWTTVDQVQDLGIAGATPPAIAASHSIAPADPSLDTVFWFDALTLPGTPNSDAFYAEFEAWMTAQWGTAAANVMRPEWSKAWAYTTADGAWTNQQILTQAIPAHYNQPPGTDTWDDARETLARYDKSRLYRDALLDVLLPG